MKIFFLILLSTFSYSKVYGPYESLGMKYIATELVNLDEVVWSLEFLNENQIIYSLRKGELGVLNLASKKTLKIAHQLTIADKGQGGLLDLAVSKDFSKDKFIYFTYSKEKSGLYTTILARGKLIANELKEITTLFEAKPYFDKTHHFGSRIIIDDNFIFITIGDRGNRDKAQSLSTHNGKIIRLNLDGSIPKSNPFYNSKGALKEIWSYGHRNPQGLALNSMDKSLWAQEHGPRGGDEINLILPSKNYGWPIITYGKEYWGPSIGEGTSKKGMEQPVKYYIPSIAPSGLLIYSGNKFNKWQGHFFSGALKLKHLNRVFIKDKKATQEERLLKELDKRIRDVIQGPDELIYISTDEGSIFQISPAN